MFGKLFAVALLAGLADSIDLTYKDCGSTARVTKVFSDDCASSVCKAKKGHSYKIQISYAPNKPVTAMQATLHGVIAGIPVPFPLPESDGCKLSGDSCPISAGTEVTFAEGLDVKSSYPAIKLVSRWELIDQDRGEVICVEIPVVIVN